MSGPGFGHWPSGVIFAFRVTRGEQHTLTRGRSRRRRRRRSDSVRVSETLEVIFRRIRRRVQVRGADCLMVRCWMVLGKIIGTVSGTLSPENSELTLSYAVTYPIKSHVDCLGSFLFDRISGDAACGVVVSDNWGCRLWMTKFFKRDAQRTGFFSIVEEGTEFGFSSTGEYFPHDLAENVDSTVCFERGSGAGRLVREEEETGGARSSFGDGQIGGVALDGEEHVAGLVSDGSFGVCGAIVE